MTDDPLDAASIRSHLQGTFGDPLRAHDSIGSTNEDALQWADEGITTGAVVVAEHQTAGRGRWGRTWSSQPGRLLQFSIVLRPDLPPADAGLITTAIGVAVARGIEAATSILPNIKWPNDVTIDGRKVAGILVESRGRSVIEIAVAGVGINVNWARAEMPEEIADVATSISEELGRSYSRAELLGSVLAEIEDVYSWRTSSTGRSRLIEEATARSVLLGEQVTIAFADGSTRDGIARRITQSGALELESAEGVEEIHVGEVTKVRARG